MVFGKGFHVFRLYVVLISMQDRGVGFGFVKRMNILDILGSIRDIAALTIVGMLPLTVVLTELFMISLTLTGITMCMHSIDGNDKLFVGKGNNVIGASFGD